MKNKLLAVALISFLMAGGLVLVGCKDELGPACDIDCLFVYGSPSLTRYCSKDTCLVNMAIAYPYSNPSAKCDCK